MVDQNRLVDSGITIETHEGYRVRVWDLVMPSSSQLSEWARSFRQNYCLDEEIDALRDGTGLSRRDYLLQLVFPDQSEKPGPSIRAGDFGELLIADYVEALGYWVPRGKYAEKASRNESVKGVDTLGFKYGEAPSPEDELLAFETKAQLTGKEYAGRLQVAIDDSSKDYLRRATSLNALKRRLLARNEVALAQVVSRFQNITDHPYRYLSGAALVASNSVYDEGGLAASSVGDHENKDNLSMIVVRGDDLMKLVHAIYGAAADEA